MAKSRPPAGAAPYHRGLPTMPVPTMSESPSGYPANPRLILKSSYRHWESEPMRWSDSDQIGHANNLAFGAYCETGRSLFTRNVIQHDYRSSRQFVVSQLIINFVGELHWPAVVGIGTGILHVGRSSCRIGQGLFDGDRCFGSAESLLVMIDTETRRPTPIPEKLRARMAAYWIP